MHKHLFKLNFIINISNKVPLYGQCDVNGPRVCAVGKCFKHNDWYSQCLIDYCQVYLICSNSCPKGWACEGIRRNLIVSEPKKLYQINKILQI